MDLKVQLDMTDSFENLSSKLQFWNVDLPNSPWDLDDDSEDLDVLCVLVRNQYLKRLRQTLLDNLDVAKGYQKEHLYEIEPCVDTCMAEMEKRALKRCMMASIYREAMSKMINNVKTCTNNSTLFDLLKNIIESNNRSSYTHNDIIKADNINNNTESVGSNTELILYKVASTQTKDHQIYHKKELMDLDNSLSSNFKTNNVNIDCVNKSKSPFSSCGVKSKISESNAFEVLNSLLESPNCPTSPYEFICNEFSNLHSISEQNDCMTSDTSMSNDALLKVLQDSPKHEQLIKMEEILTAHGIKTENYKSPENFSNSPASNCFSPNTVRPNKIKEILLNKFKSERVAKTYELQKSMKDLPREQQTKLNKSFDDLFGVDHTYESDPLSTEEQRIIAHKRIVKMVVEFMTPYYKAQRINRQLFKSLAKLISKNLMDRSYDPDAETVAQGVNEFFIGNRCIKTLEDIYQ